MKSNNNFVKNLMKFTILAVVTTILVLLSSCSSSTRLTLLWEDTEYVHGQIEKVIVVTIHNDSLIRRATEYHVKKRLVSEGVNAIASLEVVPAQQKISREDFQKIFQDHDFDGVLTIRKIAEDTKTSSGYNYNYTQNSTYNGFYGYYNMVHDMSTSSQYTIRDKWLKIEVNLYDTLDEKLIWASMAESKNPDKLSDVVLPLSRMLADELIQDNFFKRK